MLSLDDITTEKRLDASKDIDRLPTLDMLRLLNEEDARVPKAVEAVLPAIAEAVEGIAARLQRGGRLIYAGAGTSGRLGVLDASECPPTYGTDPGLVVGLIAGGREAMFVAKEGAEDSEELAQEDMTRLQLAKDDALVAIAASGRTPYALGALKYAREQGALSIALSCSEGSPLAEAAEIAITPVTGPEVITGSTRMKAGTAQKLVLNMLSTGTMVRLGKVYGNLMVDVRATNEKLRARARRIVMEAAGVTAEQATRLLAEAEGSAKLAILMALTGKESTACEVLLAKADGHLREAIEEGGKKPT